jgi:hypothetical protein
MSGRDDSGAAAMAMALADKISRWDYGKSVGKMRPLVKQWKQATKEMLRELYIAKEFFTRRKGQYNDPEAPGYLHDSWSGYCGEIGLSYQTANNWLRLFRYVPRELSETGRDALMLLEAPAKEGTAADRALIRARVEEYLRTGARPPGWRDDKEETELLRQMKNAEYSELAEGHSLPDISSVKDYFSDALRRSKDIAQFKLGDTAQMQAQLKLFRYIEAYLKTFDDPETRALAALNLAFKTRGIANKLAEEHFQMQEAAGGKA